MAQPKSSAALFQRPLKASGHVIAAACVANFLHHTNARFHQDVQFHLHLHKLVVYALHLSTLAVHCLVGAVF